MQEVTLIQMLDARERRAWEQRQLLARYGKPIICFTMNIPGPVKDSPLIQRSFGFGISALTRRIPAETILSSSERREVTGCEYLAAVNMEPEELKRLCTEIEDSCPLGRLFDMDVLTAEGKLDRELVAGLSRDCIVCGAPGRGCASRRIHSAPELQAAVWARMRAHFAPEDCAAIGALAEAALLDEVRATPKPGLVDCRNSGSHRDMDISTFQRSAEALRPYFADCARIGMETARLAPEKTFPLLRQAGIQAEQDMLEATGGVNTHKGAIFTMGLICGALGRLWDPEEPPKEADVFAQVSAMTASAMARDFAARTDDTAGQRLYAQLGIRGVRGEAAMGLPSVAGIGLPVYRRLRRQGMDRNLAGVLTLLQLITRVEDTNMLHRGGKDLAREAVERAAALLKGTPELREIEALDDWFIEKNLSPGGCADLLAAVYFADSLAEKGLLLPEGSAIPG